MKTVAVEQGLTPVKEYLSQHGCNVVDVPNGETIAKGACVMVVTGADKNIMGMQSITQNIPIISADGLSPEDVFNRVKSHIQ